MPLLLLLSNDESLRAELESLLIGQLPGSTVLRFASPEDLAACTAALGPPAITLVDSRSASALTSSLPQPRLWICGDEAPPLAEPALRLPLRPTETLSLLRLLLTPGAAAEPLQSRGRKWEAIARFQSGLAHDLNNCLTTLMGNLDFLPEQLPHETEMLNDLRSACEAAASLIRQVQTFTRRDPLPPHPFCIDALLRQLHESARRLCGPGCRLEMFLPDEGVYALGDESALEQILLNWMACSAPELSRLFVALQAHDDRVDLLLSVPADHPVLPADETRIPGLHCTRELLRGGEWTLRESASSLTLSFPRSFEALAPPPPAVPLPRLRFVVAESHPELRSFIGRALQRTGHSVDLAADVPDLLQQLGRTPAPDLLLVDAQLWGGGVRALSASPHGTLPAPCLWMLPDAGFRRSLPASAFTLAKPFSFSHLTQAIASALSLPCLIQDRPHGTYPARKRASC